MQPGQVLLGRYRIEQVLGQGGFGAVYRAWDLNLSHVCAIKENLATTPDAQRQFMREATVLANLSHPNLPRVTDYFLVPEQGQYLVMDFIEGDDIDTLVHHQGPIPAAQAIGWISQIADALVYLHGQRPPVLHRDIKPANIRITPDGHAVLVDFGLVKVFDPNLRTTMGARAVTPGYAPPEQYGRGMTDVRTDIYALGATLYMVLTGQEPTESVHRMGTDPMLPAHQMNPRVTPELGQNVARAMSIDLTQRFQSMADFKTAILPSPTPSRPNDPVSAPSAQTMVAQSGTQVMQPVSQYPTTPPFMQPVSQYPAMPPAMQPVSQYPTVAATGPGLSVSGQQAAYGQSIPQVYQPSVKAALPPRSRKWMVWVVGLVVLGLVVALLAYALSGTNITTHSQQTADAQTQAAQVTKPDKNSSVQTIVAATAGAGNKQATFDAIVASTHQAAETATAQARATPVP